MCARFTVLSDTPIASAIAGCVIPLSRNNTIWIRWLKTALHWKIPAAQRQPKQHSSGGRDRLGSISKQGDRYLRSLFVAGALAVIRYAKIHGSKHRPWLTALLARRHTKVAAIALANKLARMAWAMMATGERYNYPASLRV